jgi:hypothetical protein
MQTNYSEWNVKNLNENKYTLGKLRAQRSRYETIQSSIFSIFKEYTLSFIFCCCCNFPFLHTIQTLQFIYTTRHYTHYIGIFRSGYIYVCIELIPTGISQVITYEMVMIRAPDNFRFWWSYFPLFLGNRNIFFFNLLITNLYFVVPLPS